MDVCLLSILWMLFIFGMIADTDNGYCDGAESISRSDHPLILF
jgi:hypothetical protein